MTARLRRAARAARRALASLLAVLILVWGGSAWAQVTSLSGSVVDDGGRPLAGAQVRLVSAAGRKAAVVDTDRQGRFAFAASEAGRYMLVISKAGFRPATKAVVLPSPPAQIVSIVLAAKSVSSTEVAGLTVTSRGPSALSGPSLSRTGANDYAVTAQDIANLPTGGASPMTDVLAQMPGVAIDQNQQIHIRNTEGPQFQYQINGVLVPLDINTNPPFLSMINPLFVRRLDLLDGVLPARYGYATGGVVDIQTKDGCGQPGGALTLTGGQRETLETSAQYGGCQGKLSYYVSGLYSQGQNAFSSATPGPDPVHDFAHQGQAFGYFSYQLAASTKLSLVLSAAASNNQLPNVPNLTPQFTLTGVTRYSSAAINSYLNFRDYLAILTLNGSAPSGLTYQLAYSAHSITQDFRPDNAGELIFQGVASTAAHGDVDNTLEGDLAYPLGAHALGAGFYAGDYRVSVNDSSLVFPLDCGAGQICTTPIRVVNNSRADNAVLGLYLDDLWQISRTLRADLGVRLDSLSGFTNHQQIDPTLNLSYHPADDATLHAGFARYMQVPSFQGISPNAPDAFAGTTAAGPPGVPTPLTEDDYEWDIGVNYHLGRRITLSQDNFYERTDHYLDTGQFGVVPIFAPFNYNHGYIWGDEFAIDYKGDHFTAYANITLGRNLQKGVATGQFNFDAAELAYINSHYIVLDHQPLAGASAGVSYRLSPYAVSLDLIYSSGLRGGFADQQQLPAVVQLNASVERAFDIPSLGRVIDRLTLVNALDRVNLIRPAEGIGIFQSAYGPRLTVLDSLTIPF